MKSSQDLTRSLFIALALTATTLASEVQDASQQTSRTLIKRGGGFQDSYNIFIRKRNAHACMMSIVFIVLFPLGAISLHLPLRGVKVTTRIHVPLQILGLAMMIGAMGLGIDIARNDLHYLGPGRTLQTHVVFGLIITSTLILFQPALGLLQHLHYRRHLANPTTTPKRRSWFSHIHRWLGRGAIICGWANSICGFDLVGWEFVSNSCLWRQFVLMGVLGLLWFVLTGWDGWRVYVRKGEKLGGYRVRWRGGVRLDGGDRRMGERVGEKIVEQGSPAS